MSEEDVEIDRVASQRRRARGLRVAARRALGLARRYREEEGPRGVREAACVRQALTWRAAARDLRKGVPTSRPGVARATGSVAPAGAESERRSG